MSERRRGSSACRAAKCFPSGNRHVRVGSPAFFPSAESDPSPPAVTPGRPCAAAPVAPGYRLGRPESRLASIDAGLGHRRCRMRRWVRRGIEWRPTWLALSVFVT
jgi:hypothetical protein